MNTKELYTEDACCGCGACVVKCPKGAISIKTNEVWVHISIYRF